MTPTSAASAFNEAFITWKHILFLNLRNFSRFVFMSAWTAANVFHFICAACCEVSCQNKTYNTRGCFNRGSISLYTIAHGIPENQWVAINSHYSLSDAKHTKFQAASAFIFSIYFSLRSLLFAQIKPSRSSIDQIDEFPFWSTCEEAQRSSRMWNTMCSHYQ